MSAAATAMWIAIGGYAAAIAGLLAAGALGSERLRRASHVAAAVAWLAHGASTVAFWVSSGHAPVTGHFEGGLTSAWFLPLVAAIAARRHPAAGRALPLVLAVTLLVVVGRLGSTPDQGPLAPAFRSNWLVVHVLFARLTFGAYVVATALALTYLWLSRGARDPARLEALEELSGDVVASGFVAHSAMLLSGALWAHELWGRYWGWDPLETWSLASWLVYAAYLHLRYTLGWAGRRAAALAALAVLGIVATFYGIGVASGAHVRTL